MFLQITRRNAVFSARCVIRTNRRAELPWCSSVCSSVCSSETGVHCDHTVHVSADLSLRLDIVQCFRHFDTNACPPTASCLFPVSPTWKRGGVWMCKLGVISQQLKLGLSYYWVLIESHTCCNLSDFCDDSVLGLQVRLESIFLRTCTWKSWMTGTWICSSRTWTATCYLCLNT